MQGEFLETLNYLHMIRLKNLDNEKFYKKQTITLVEIPKFLKGQYGADNSMPTIKANLEH